MLKTKFASRTDYLNALRENPLELAFVPMSLAAEEIGVKRSTVADLVRAKKLRKVVVSESSLRWSGVQALSLMDYLTNRESLESTSHCQALNILKEQARAGGLIAYGDLLIQLGMSHMNPYERGLIGAILGDISTQTWEKHGFMLSALAVFKGSQRACRHPSARRLRSSSICRQSRSSICRMRSSGVGWLSAICWLNSGRASRCLCSAFLAAAMRRGVAPRITSTGL